jgi:hypothetical protein
MHGRHQPPHYSREPSLLMSMILLPIALFCYCHRHRDDPPFEKQWHWGCGWFPSETRQ